MHPLFHPLYVEFCIYFNGNQDYFECHEVLEEYWKELAPGEKHHTLVGLVQLATGMYHWRRGNFTGAERILTKANTILRKNETSTFLARFDKEDLFTNIEAAIAMTSKLDSFQPFTLKIVDSSLHEQVLAGIRELPPIVDKEFLLHKHRLRDRSDILNTRREKLYTKHAARD